MTKLIKYGLIGSKGRLGQEVISVFSEAGYECVYELNSGGSNLNQAPEILIDCSLPKVFDKSISLVKNFNVPFITAVTGLGENEIGTLKELSNITAVIQSYNFSVGIQVLLKLAGIAGDILKDYDIGISESHHRFKKDKPSGTAKMIEKLFPDKKIEISSFRLGNIPGDHTIYFGGLGEVLSISHKALSRRTFAEGILKSAEFLINKKSGFFSFTDVLFDQPNKKV